MIGMCSTVSEVWQDDTLDDKQAKKAEKMGRKLLAKRVEEQLQATMIAAELGQLQGQEFEQYPLQAEWEQIPSADPQEAVPILPMMPTDQAYETNEAVPIVAPNQDSLHKSFQFHPGRIGAFYD